MDPYQVGLQDDLDPLTEKVLEVRAKMLPYVQAFADFVIRYLFFIVLGLFMFMYLKDYFMTKPRTFSLEDCKADVI